MTEDLIQKLTITGQDEASSTIRGIIETLTQLDRTAQRTSETLKKAFGADLGKRLSTLKTGAESIGTTMTESAERTAQAMKADIAAVNDLQKALRSLNAEQRRMGGSRSRVRGALDADKNAHVRRYSQILRGVRAEKNQAEKQDKDFWKQQRARMRLLDRTEAVDRARVRREETAIRRADAHHAKLKKQVTGGLAKAGHKGMHAVRSMGHPFFSSPAFLAMASLTTALYGLTRVIEDGARIDKGVVDLSLRGNLPEGAIKGRTNTALRNSIQYGVGAEHFLAIDTETGARGLPQEMQKSLGPQIMKFAEATGQRPEDAARHSSEFIQQLFSMGKIKDSASAFKILNTTAAVANNFGGSDKMMAAMENGLAERGSEMGLNPNDSVTLAALMNSSGARSGLATARAMGLLSKGAPNWKAEWLDKIQHGDMSDARTRAFVTAPKTLGYGSMDQMASAAHGEQGLKGVLDFLQSFKRIGNDSQRKMLEEQFGFTEQMGGIVEGLINSPEKIARAKALADKTYGENDDDQSYSSIAQKKNRKGLEFMLGVFTSGLEAMAYKTEDKLKTRVLAKLIGPWQQLSDWSVDHLPATIDTIVNSLMTGLGFTDVRGKGSVDVFVADLQKSVVGIDWATVGRDVGLAIKGVGEGISQLGKDLHYALGFISKFTGDGSIEGLARLTTEMFGFALAIHAITPVIGTLNAITSGISALKSILVATQALGLLMAGGAAEGGAIAGAGALAVGLLPVAIAGMAIAAIAVTIMNWGAITDAWTSSIDHLKDAILGAVPKLDDAQKGDLGGLKDREKNSSESFQQGPNASSGGFVPMSWDGGDFRSMITKASYSPSDSGEVVKDAMVDSSRTMIQVRDELITTNDLLKQSVLGDVGGEGPHGGDGDSGGARNMRYGPGGRSPGGGGGGGPTVSGGSGGSRSWRNNNPGNIEYGSYAKSMGAIGTDGRFAVFPNYQAGRKAQEHLLFESKGYKDLTLAGAINKWAPGSENNVPAYIKAMGGDPNAKMSSFSPEQRSALLDAMQKHEGWKVGTKQNSDVSGPPVAMSGDAADRIQTMRKAGLLSDEQCVTLAMASVGIRKGVGQGGNVHDWRAGIEASAGTLKPGTPISTFLNRDGSQSDRYAGGGSGTPGAHLDHAGMFEKYIMDAAGKRIGFMMAEQFAGSHGVHDKAYYFGKGAGEGNASNYRAVMAGGQGLGGDNNPLNVKMDPKSIAQSSTSIAKKVQGVTNPQGDDDSDFKKAGGMSADASSTVNHITQHFHHAVVDPHHLASIVGRELENTLSSRTHDVDPYVS